MAKITKVTGKKEEKKQTHLEIIKADKTVTTWLNSINARPSTRKNFTHGIAMYTEFLNKTPDELLEEAETEATLPPRKRNLKNNIVNFRVHLQEKGVSEFTVRSRITAVKSFYASNEIVIPKIKFDKPVTLESNDIVPTKEDLQDCLAVCDPLEKAIMLAGISSGLAANELRSLKLQKFLDGYDEVTGIATLENLYRQKTKVKGYTTFFSPEASKAILEYIEYRNRTVKGAGVLKQQQREKQRTTKNSYLFILKNISDTYLETKDEELRKMGENALLNIYKGISEKARKNTDKGYNFIRSHTMRKYFNSALLNAGCDNFSCEFWMGHKLSDTQAAYFRANIQAQKELYMKFVPYLTIQSELDIASSREFKNAIEERDHYKALAQKYLIDNVELLNAKSELATLKFKTLNPEQQKEELIKSITELKPVLSSNPTDKDREQADYEIKMRDMILQILKSKESL